MVDVVDKKTRSRMMSGIKGKNTRPELEIRKELFSRGFRYKLHDKSLPGKPDLVFPQYNSVIFIHGCFWHGHSCHLFKWPATRPGFWKNKILRNKLVDKRNYKQLNDEGWYILTIWECAIKGRTRKSVKTVVNSVAKWLEFDNRNMVIK